MAAGRRNYHSCALHMPCVVVDVSVYLYKLIKYSVDSF